MGQGCIVDFDILDFGFNNNSEQKRKKSLFVQDRS